MTSNTLTHDIPTPVVLNHVDPMLTYNTNAMVIILTCVSKGRCGSQCGVPWLLLWDSKPESWRSWFGQEMARPGCFLVAVRLHSRQNLIRVENDWGVIELPSWTVCHMLHGSHVHEIKENLRVDWVILSVNRTYNLCAEPVTRLASFVQSFSESQSAPDLLTTNSWFVDALILWPWHQTSESSLYLVVGGSKFTWAPSGLTSFVEWFAAAAQIWIPKVLLPVCLTGGWLHHDVVLGW